MQIVKLLGLEGNPEDYLKLLETVFSATLEAATIENDLRSYLIATTMLDSIRQGKDMLERHGGKYYCYNAEPQVYRFEQHDSIEEIMRIKMALNNYIAFA